MSVNNFNSSISSGLNNFTKSKVTGKDSAEFVHGSLVTADDVLDDTDAINIELQNSTFFASSGSARLIKKIDGSEALFTYTGKTPTSLIGCTIISGSFAFSNGDKVEII